MLHELKKIGRETDTLLNQRQIEAAAPPQLFHIGTGGQQSLGTDQYTQDQPGHNNLSHMTRCTSGTDRLQI